ncbi:MULTISPECIES: ParA family protein [unclassified Fusibacter]|uniref:ParA family protein n=1 Tax=unclassified Fusibacter TaxID=2624464 RepID=UPI001010CFFD|nr:MULTISPECIES: AAA family ATPase [unclassified Fusibacter]MCK8060856.1 AAA family ATPase [Fusibacter sp. A2]NPE23152.1 ParA family protein [Fusibacter sp. A1]RXV59510.1 ParA family protein [Fusibacter sp. A1]
MAKAIAIFNQKGGVGKTTTNINLSACLASMGKKVLIIDNDPQGNSTSGLGINKNTTVFNLYDLLLGEISAQEGILKTGFKNLDIIPSNVQLAGAEIEMIDIDNREFRLKVIIDALRDQYDYIFIDCPPSLGLLTINSLVAVDSILVPIQCEYYALEGVSQLINTYKLMRKGLNKTLQIEGVLISMYDSRTNLSQQVVDEVEKYFQGKVYKTRIPRNIRLAEAPSYGMPIMYYDEKSKGAESYMALAKEIIEGANNG